MSWLSKAIYTFVAIQQSLPSKFMHNNHCKNIIIAKRILHVFLQLTDSMFFPLSASESLLLLLSLLLLNDNYYSGIESKDC